jgi:hypothetical protein
VGTGTNNAPRHVQLQQAHGDATAHAAAFKGFGHQPNVYLHSFVYRSRVPASGILPFSSNASIEARTKMMPDRIDILGHHMANRKKSRKRMNVIFSERILYNRLTGLFFYEENFHFLEESTNLSYK